MIARLPDWRARLAEFVTTRRARPYEFGVSDGCLFAADAVQAITGRDFAAVLRGYTTPRGALKRLRRAGCESVADFVAQHLTPTARARTGDVVMLPTPPFHDLMIVDVAGAAWGQDEHGLSRLAIPAGATFWSV